MTSGWKRAAIIGLAMVLAAVVQCAYGDAAPLSAVRFDLLTTLTVVVALFGDPASGAAVGFWAGVFSAAIAAPPHGGFGSLMVSRTIVGFAVGWLEERVFRDSPVSAFVLVALGTPLAEVLFFVFDPQRSLGNWAHAVLAVTIGNALLAVPMYSALRRVLSPKSSIARSGFAASI